MHILALKAYAYTLRRQGFPDQSRCCGTHRVSRTIAYRLSGPPITWPRAGQTLRTKPHSRAQDSGTTILPPHLNFRVAARTVIVVLALAYMPIRKQVARVCGSETKKPFVKAAHASFPFHCSCHGGGLRANALSFHY